MWYRELGSGETCAWNRQLLARYIHAIAGALPIVSHIGRAKPFDASSHHWGREPKSGRTPTIVDSTCRADEPGTRCPAVPLCLTNMSSQSCRAVLVSDTTWRRGGLASA